MKIWQKVNVLKSFCEGEHQLYFEMKERYKVSRVKIFIFFWITRVWLLFEVLHTSSLWELAKLLVFRANVGYSNYYLPTCLRAYVPLFFRSVRALRGCIYIYIYIYIFHTYVPSCLRALIFRVFTYLRTYKDSQNILRLTSILCIAVFL